MTRTAAGYAVRKAGPVTVAFCAPPTEPKRIENLCRPGLRQPSYPPQLRVAWSGTAAVVPAAAPGRLERNGRGSYTIRLPTGARNLNGLARLGVRLAVDPTDARNPKGASQSLSLVLRDASGKAARVVLRSGTAALRYPTGTFTAKEPRGFAALSSVRIPLSAFRGIDKRHAASVSLEFDRTPKGAILFTDLELQR